MSLVAFKILTRLGLLLMLYWSRDYTLRTINFDWRHWYSEVSSKYGLCWASALESLDLLLIQDGGTKGFQVLYYNIGLWLMKENSAEPWMQEKWLKEVTAHKPKPRPNWWVPPRLDVISLLLALNLNCLLIVNPKLVKLSFALK